MSTIVLVAPLVLTQVPENPWPGVEISWTSPDGTRTWVLTDDLSPVRLLAGTRGLTMPRATRFVDEAPGLAGSRLRGHRVGPREVFWPLLLLAGASTQEVLDVDAEFWASLDFEEAGTWRVRTPDRGSRTLQLRLVEEDTAWDLAPGLVEWSSYEVRLVADDPFWRSELVTRELTAGAAARFADPETPPLWHISSSSSMATATIQNPGNVTGWAEWWFAGPSDSAFGGVSGRRVTVPFAIPDGQMVVVDTDPSERRAIQIDTPDLTDLSIEEQRAAVHAALPSGTDRTIDLADDTAFVPVPPGADVGLDVGMVGTGAVRVLLSPRHHRAWG